jgi:hypothetical protein
MLYVFSRNSVKFVTQTQKRLTLWDGGSVCNIYVCVRAQVWGKNVALNISSTLTLHAYMHVQNARLRD